jgi:regulator of cell morphogenesis and NO signaling
MSNSKTVGQYVVERPARARVFENFGIDYCCGGKKPLEQVCLDKKIDLQQVLAALEQADAPNASAEDWSQASMTELADHIEARHHQPLKRELERLDFFTEKMARKHGTDKPELVAVRELFVALRQDLEQHLAKEEQILFPLCRQLEAAGGPVASHCGSVANPIAVMVREHEGAGELLARLRAVTHDYTVPEDACNTFRAVYASLAELEADLHVHIHKENNILFPRAIEVERGRTGCVVAEGASA